MRRILSNTTTFVPVIFTAGKFDLRVFMTESSVKSLDVRKLSPAELREARKDSKTRSGVLRLPN